MDHGIMGDERGLAHPTFAIFFASSTHIRMISYSKAGMYSFFGSNWSCRQVGIQPRRTPTNDLPKSINDYEYDMHKQSRHCARTVLLISQVEGGQRGQDPRSI